MTRRPRRISVAAMRRIDVKRSSPQQGDDSGVSRHEGMLIGPQLQKLAKELGLNQRRLAILVGIDPRQFTNLWGNKRAAGLQAIVKIAHATGRSVAELAGDETARPTLGTLDAFGRLMTSIQATSIAPSIIAMPTACGPFPAGARLFVDPCVFRSAAWLLIRGVKTGESWIAWSERQGSIDILRRPSGELVIHDPTHHEVLGAITGVLMEPPRP